MPTAKTIRETVLAYWEAYKAMGWTSPSRTIKYYEANPEAFSDDEVELHAAGTRTERRTEPSEDVKDQTRRTSLAIQNIKRLAERGYGAEEIQKMVPDFTDGSRWSLGSIQKIAEGEMGIIAVWARDFGRGL